MLLCFLRVRTGRSVLFFTESDGYSLDLQLDCWYSLALQLSTAAASAHCYQAVVVCGDVDVVVVLF